MAVTSDEISRVVEGQTVASEFLRSARAHADRVALRWRNDDGSWGEWTFAEYAQRVAEVVAGLQAMGVQPGDRVVMMVRNRPEFHAIDVATTFCGATPVSIYNSSSPEQVQYLVDHCGAVVAIAEDIGFLERFLKVRSELASVRHLGVLDDPEGLAPADVFGAADLHAHGAADLEAQVGVCEPDQLATIIYTSGTTGPPKGVMLTHRNVCWEVESTRRLFTFDDPVGKRVVSYLPMAHIAERAVSHYGGAFLGLEVTTCPDPTAVAEYLREVRPHLVFGVPRVWEKIYAGVNAALALDPDKAAQFNEGVAAALPLAEKVDWGTATDEERGTWDFLQAVFGAVRELVGLDQTEMAVTGAAPIPPEMLSWFRAIGVPLSEVYGMSENTGAMTWTPVRVKAGTVGPAVPGCEVALADDGEIICRGGNVFAGYLNDPEKTADALDDDGWLHTGDIGQIDDDGYVRVVDRKKELIITAGGKNISPANLEAALKMIPLVAQACAVGDQRPFVAALVVLDPEVAPAWAASQGIEYEVFEELAEHPAVLEEIDRGLREVMAHFNNAERVKKVRVLTDEWLPDSDVLTPTAKLKRRGILARYAVEIETLYGS